jgi:hypothetical protein
MSDILAFDVEEQDEIFGNYLREIQNEFKFSENKKQKKVSENEIINLEFQLDQIISNNAKNINCGKKFEFAESFLAKYA